MAIVNERYSVISDIVSDTVKRNESNEASFSDKLDKIITNKFLGLTIFATMGLIYPGLEEGRTVLTAIKSVFTPLSAMVFMVMSLLYTPCLVALGAIRRETNLKWTIFTAMYTFFIGWAAAVLVYQIGSIRICLDSKS